MRTIIFRVVAAFVLAGLPGILASQEPAAVEAFIQKCEQARPRAVADAKADLEAAKSELAAAQQGTVNRQATRPMKLPNGRTAFPTAKAKADAVATADRKSKAAKERLAVLERPGELFIPALPGNYGVGDVGRLERGAANVLQVIDGSNMLVTGRIGSDTIFRGDTGGYEAGSGPTVSEPP